MTALLLRLAFAGIRSRLLASALTIAIAGAAAATIVLALEVRSSGRDPWQQTFDAANGPHVLVFAHSQADAREIADLPGVTERAAPVPLVTATLGPTLGAARKHRSSRARRPESSHSREHARADLRLAAARGGHRARTQPRPRTRHRRWRHAGAHDPTRLGRAFRFSGRRSSPASRATLAATPVLPGSPARRSSGSSRIAPAGAGQRRFDSRIPRRPRRSPRRRLRASRRPRCSPALFTSRPGTTSAPTHWPMHSRSSSSWRRTPSCS